MALDAATLGALAGVVSRDINDIADLPDYVTPPPGVYTLIVKEIKQDEVGKDKDKKTVLKVTYAVVNCLELNNPEQDTEHLPKEGDLFSEVFFFNDPEKVENTLGILKKKYQGMAEACGTTNLLEILQKLEGMQVKSVVTNRVDGNDKSKVYASTKDVVPAV
jgi:hypothetical protein